MDMQSSGGKPPPGLLLLVEDDTGVRRALQLLLQGQGFDVRSFAASKPALADPDSLKATHLVVDYALPDGDGITMVRALRSHGWDGTAILISAFSSPRIVEAARLAGIAAVIDKPFRDSQLLAVLEKGASPTSI